MKIKWPPSLTSTLLTRIIIIIRIIIPLIGREKDPGDSTTCMFQVHTIPQVHLLFLQYITRYIQNAT